MDLLQPGTRAMQNCDTGKRAGEEEGGNRTSSRRNEKRSCQVRHLDYNRPVNLSPISIFISSAVGGKYQTVSEEGERHYRETMDALIYLLLVINARGW